MSSTEYDAHQKRKNDGLNLKEQDKINSDDHKIITVTADTESLLLSPLNDANIMFFRTKLNLHNFTFYNLKNKDVMNYLWSEVNGDLEASNFTSCYIAYLERLTEEYADVTTVILWTDGCSYQNRCSVLASALLTFAVSTKLQYSTNT